jgi:ABC-type dipeptide/oligopeptide/nickel transport system permease component
LKLYEYALRRLGLMVFVLFGLTLMIFLLLRGALPPTFALAPYITPRMSTLQKLQLAQSLGVATKSCPSFTAFSSLQPSCLVPVWQQYGTWLQTVLEGKWGYTLLPGIAGTQTTLSVFFDRFPYTAQLALMGAILTIAIGIPLGIISATHNNKWPDHLSRIISLGGYSIPQFWFGAVLVILLALDLRIGGLGLLPTSGPLATNCAICFSNPPPINTVTGSPILDGLIQGNFEGSWDSFVAFLLPAFTLSITSIGALTRIVRSSMLEVLKQDYILLARSKGLSGRVVIYRHALKNALLPAVTIAGLLTAFLFGGVVVIEIVFNLPGVGSTSLSAFNVDDVNFIELYVLVTAAIIVVANLMVDIIYAKLDPRIRY